MRVHMIEAAEGDSLLLESSDTQPRFALIDGGPKGNFARNVQPYLAQTLGSPGKLDMVMVSHIDADHIAGILDLLAELERAAADGEQRLRIADLWHNSFSATIDNPEGSLQSNLQALMTMAGRAQVASPFGAVALLGINQGAQLRRLALKLGIPINAAFNGEPIVLERQATRTWQFGDGKFSVVGPTQANLRELQTEWVKWIEEHVDAFAVGDRDAMANADTSVPNLSSIVVLGETPHGDILLTGDARGDHILQGLQQSGALAPGKARPLRLLKLQHHGSDRNVTREFFDRLPADIYVVSANGKHGNPDLEPLTMIVDSARAAGRNPLIVLTNRTPTVAQLIAARPPASSGYRLAIRDDGAHAVVVDLATGTVTAPVTGAVPFEVPDDFSFEVTGRGTAVQRENPFGRKFAATSPQVAPVREGEAGLDRGSNDRGGLMPRSTRIRRGAVVPRGGDAGLGAGGEEFIWHRDDEAAVVDAAVVQVPAAPLADAQVERFLGAEMQPNPRLAVPANLYVTVSPDPVVVPDHAAAATLNAPVALQANRPLKVEAIGLRNCQVLEPTVQEVDPSDPDEVVLKFRVRGTAAGNATVLVEARQNNATLATFTLEPVFVDAVPTPLRAQATLAAAPAVRPGRMVLRIYEFPDANALQFNLTSDDPEIAELQLHRIDARVSLRDHAGAVLAAVEKAWNLRQGGNRQEIYKSFVERLQSDALIRTRDLVPEPIRRLLWRHRDAITSIQVISNEPYIPWELMCLGDPDGPGHDNRFLAEWGLTRWLHNAPLGRKRRPFAAGTLNYVIPDYADPKMALKGAAEEKAMLGNAFAGIAPLAANSSAIREFLANGAGNCALLHFACHGEARQDTTLDANLRMLDAINAEGTPIPDPLTWQDISVHTDFGAGGGPLVFVNACQTGRSGGGISGVAGFAGAFLRPESRHGAAAFIGALWSVDDRLANVFASTVYAGLNAGQSLDDAVAAARKACRDGDDFTWLAYTVYGG